MAGGEMKQQKAAGVIALSLSDKLPNAYSAALMDFYLSKPFIYDQLVGSCMLVNIHKRAPAIAIDSRKRQERIENLLSAERTWQGHCEATSATIAEALQVIGK